MSTTPVPTSTTAAQTARRSASPPAWMQAEGMWASLAIAVMWMAVLFLGIYGGDIVNDTPGGTTSHVPSAVAVALLALIATIFVARWGLRPEGRVARLETELAETRRNVEALERDVDRLSNRAEAARHTDAP